MIPPGGKNLVVKIWPYFKLRIWIVFSNICALNWPKSKKKRKIMKDSFKNWQFQNSKRKKVKMKRYYHCRKLGLLIRDLSARDRLIPDSSVGQRSAITVDILGFGRQGHSNSIWNAKRSFRAARTKRNENPSGGRWGRNLEVCTNSYLWLIDYDSLKHQFSKLFRQQMLAKFAEDDRIELMNAQKRRMKVILSIYARTNTDWTQSNLF